MAIPPEPREPNDDDINSIKIALDELKQLGIYREISSIVDVKMTSQDANGNPVVIRKRTIRMSQWRGYWGAAFILLGVGLLGYTIVGMDVLPAQKARVVNIVVAMCMAAGSTFFDGTTTFVAGLPLPNSIKDNPARLRATGAAAIFFGTLVLLFLLDPGT